MSWPHLLRDPDRPQIYLSRAGKKTTNETNGYGAQDASLEFAERAIAYFTGLDEPPTAIMAMHDLLAIGAIKAALRRGIEVPKQLSITGFDNLPMTSHLEVPLTTVEQPFSEIGETAVRLLDRRIKSVDAPVEKVLLPTRLIVRASTAPPSSTR